MDEPLTVIRRLMLESNRLLTIVLRKTFIESGKGKPQSDIGEKEYDLSGKWITSSYCQIESAMVFQIGLPILILREKGVTETYLPEFDLTKNDSYLESNEWQQIIGKWEGFVRKIVQTKDSPPKLY